MKKLIVSYKTPSESLNDFQKALSTAKKKKAVTPHFEIAFTLKKDFIKFLNNIDLLIFIRTHKPSSVYELAKMMNKDQSNINKLIQFFETCGVIKIKKTLVSNREVKRPIVDYQKIEFDLTA